MKGNHLGEFEELVLLTIAVLFDDASASWLVAVSNEGRLLVFPVTELPELARGKGNKIINIPSE